MMDQNNRSKFHSALQDFYSAQRHAAVEEIVSRLTGAPSQLLQYEDVRRHFYALEAADSQLQDIPLDSIIGSVSRQNDFSRKLLPLNANDMERWAKVKTMVEELSGLPPIEVYQVGEAYFIIDGHHRASVARELKSTHIQAYVRKVFTRVPITPEDNFEDLILKSEYADFLTKTCLDELRPGADLHGTILGEYQSLLEHIKTHQYLFGINKKRAISLEEAVVDWYDHVYLPVINIIRTRNLMRKFSDRTETDLYYWIMDYRNRKEQELGWKLTPRDAVENLTFNYARNIKNRIIRFTKKMSNLLIPEPLEPGAPPGFWRKNRRSDEENRIGLFDTILVALPENETTGNILDAALFIAKNEHSVVNGLTIVPNDVQKNSPQVEQIRRIFAEKCQSAGIEGSMAVETGQVTRVMFDRSFWVDLIILPLSFPPPFKLLKRLGSGIRTLIRRSACPLLFVPLNAPTAIHNVLLAYGGGRLADEALYMAAYLCIRFTMELTVITIGETVEASGNLHHRARAYLEQLNIKIVNYIEEQGEPARAILNTCQSCGCDVILMGGYEGGLFKELFSDNTLDRVLNETNRMVMICR
ncbi:MAG: universal stress protein UspA [Chloroflexi bacterium HGW-Chloroflexi-10]|nr:MAG: universal stress protein UspA [Chloroflexi bacterium HGW-Chloroflexi-10]